MKELELQNIARRGAGLPEIKAKVVKCAGGCGKLIQSIDNRMCVKCRSESVPMLSGHEVYL